LNNTVVFSRGNSNWQLLLHRSVRAVTKSMPRFKRSTSILRIPSAQTEIVSKEEGELEPDPKHPGTKAT